ncbi:MAG: hypothetical protein RLZZ450_4144 [Pseudomonadota bacterium]|jgi:hypothetical protein
MKLDGRAAVRALLLASLVAVGVAWASAALPGRSRVVAEPLPEGSANRAPLAAAKEGAPVACPKVEASHVEGRVASGDIDELSGLVASRRHPGVFWVHNDSGDDARVFAIDAHGKTLAELSLSGADATDIEDIALGKGAAGTADVLYVADTGDNLKRRRSVQIYRVAEPLALPRTESLELKQRADTLEVVYEDGPHDVETLLVDPVQGDLYLVAKAHLLLREEPVGVYRLARAELSTKRKNVARKVASIRLGPATGGDIAADGSAILVRNYWSAMYWPRASGQTIVEALAKAPCRLTVSDVGYQGEAIGFTPGGEAYVTIAEGNHPAIFRYVFGK